MVRDIVLQLIMVTMASMGGGFFVSFLIYGNWTFFWLSIASFVLAIGVLVYRMIR